MSRADDAIGRYRRFWRRKLADHEAQVALRRSEGRRLAAACAALLAGKYGVRRVTLIGSLAFGRAAHESPDIDLMVEGLAPREYLSAVDALHRIVRPEWKVDLIPWEDAFPPLREVGRKGIVLYEEPSEDSGGRDSERTGKSGPTAG
jgi:predicted nucleotidyltransferase